MHNQQDQRNQHNQQENTHQGSTVIRIVSDSEETKLIVDSFITDFGYDLISYTNENKPLITIIKECNNEIMYEMENFSRKYPETTFKVENYNFRQNKVFKLLTITNGNVVEKIFKGNSKPKHNNNNQSSKPNHNPNQNKNKNHTKNTYQNKNENKPIRNESSQSKPEIKTEKKIIVKKRTYQSKTAS